jgi:hypothetical protein
MKFLQLVLIGLIATAVLGADQAIRKPLSTTSHAQKAATTLISSSASKPTRTGMKEVDSVYEETETVKVEAEASYKLQEGELLETEYQINSTVPFETKTFTTFETYIDDKGNVRDREVNTTVNIYESKKVKRIKRFWSRRDKLDSVKYLALVMSDEFGSALNKRELELFNSIAITDGNEFESRYNYLQTPHETMDEVIRKALSIYKTHLPEPEVVKLIERVKRCDDNAISEVIVSDDAEVHAEKAWTVVSQIFLATCKKELPFVQVLTWYGKKSGSYKPGKFSVDNSKLVDVYITRFLLQQVGLMFSCKGVKELKTELQQEIARA